MTNKKNMENSDLRQKMHESVDNIMDKADNMTENGKEASSFVKEKMIAARENIDQHIGQNPERSVLIAAGIGAVTGAIITAALIKKKGTA